MKCDDIFEVILSDGELSEEMGEHIARCEDCQSLRAAVSALDEAGEKDRTRDVSPATIDAVISGGREIQAVKDRPPHTQMTEWWFLRGLAAAAAVVLVLGGGSMLIQRFLSDDEPAAVTVAAAGDFPSGDIDAAMTEARRDVDGFDVRHAERTVLAGIDADMMDLRGRLALASIGVERELAGLR